MITLKKYFHLIFSICLLLFMNHPSFGSNHASFLSLSDIHFDPFTICDKKATSCPLIEKLANASSQEWKNILIQFDQEPAKYQQDTNYPLLAATLQTVGTVATTKKTRFVLILGDYLAHHYKEKYQQFAVDKSNAGYQAFVKKTMEFITQELNTTFPTQDVYMLPGNNDSYLDDNVYEPHGIFFQEMAMLWSTAIKNSAAKSEMLTLFSQNGYYAVTPRKQPNMRIIALNSNLFSPVAKGNNIEAAANAQLDWLEQQLESALNQHQKVIIAMHIPAGIDAFASLHHTPFAITEHWQPVFTQRFERLLQNYTTEIMGIFAAHEHSDWFRVYTNPLTNQKIAINGIPGISPANKNNPAFKLFDYNLKTLTLADYTKYFYPLDSIHQWREEYRFNTIYQSNCHECRLIDGMELLPHSDELAMQYKKFYDAETHTDLIQTNYVPYYVCQLQTIDAATYQACLNSH